MAYYWVFYFTLLPLTVWLGAKQKVKILRECITEYIWDIVCGYIIKAKFLLSSYCCFFHFHWDILVSKQEIGMS